MFFGLLCLAICLGGFVNAVEKGDFMGCYTLISTTNHSLVLGNSSPSQCINDCFNKYYRYASLFIDETCGCSNYLGDQNDINHCTMSSDFITNRDVISDVYFTGITVNGPAHNLKISNTTDTTAHLTWEKPESFLKIDHYVVKVSVLRSYSMNKLVNLEWSLSNNTFRYEMINLHPGTLYNVTVIAEDTNGLGTPESIIFSTEIGEPDQQPSEPRIIKQEGNIMSIKIAPVTNNNGPVSSYLIIVINADSVQAVQTENLKSYRQAHSEDYSYYITAEVQPERIDEPFIVGNGRIYGKYYNAPLEKNGSYHIMVAVVSKSETMEKLRFSSTAAHEHDVILLHMNDNQDQGTPVLVIILSVSIAVITCLLIAGVVVFYFLRNQVYHRHRQRLNDNQELTLQGPMINIANNGYISDEEPSSSNHYENLNDQIWTIPRSLLNIEHVVLLGIGKFGRVHSGTVLKDDTLLPVGVYSIADRKLNAGEKRQMLKDLDVLIKSQKHENILELIGTCESMDTVCVVLEYTSMNLKELLLNSRILISNRFTSLSESQAIDFATDICKGMAFLHSKRILHNHLCAAHIAIVNGNCAKISGFGLAKYYKTDNTPNAIRYTSSEVLHGQQHTVKSDVWSFACVLWEICCVGGTPYGDIPNNELPDKVKKGLYLQQLPYIYDGLYQIMLNCWQIDIDERPMFSDLIEYLNDVVKEPYLSFIALEEFQYMPYYPELENTCYSTH